MLSRLFKICAKVVAGQFTNRVQVAALYTALFPKTTTWVQKLQTLTLFVRRFVHNQISHAQSVFPGLLHTIHTPNINNKITKLSFCF